MISNQFPWNSPLRAGWALLGMLVLANLPLWAGPADEAIYAARAVAEYHQDKLQYAAATNGAPAAWIFARACYDLADYATNDQNRAALAQEGMDAARKLIAAQPLSGPGHYYLGMNEGQMARTELVGALFLVVDMEGEFKLAWTYDPNVDHGGPARSLGLLYRDAPGWPTSIGSKRKAREWMERSEKVDPNFPENPMVLCESALKWDDFGDARKYCRSLQAIWPHAQTNLTGIAWQHDWADWTARRAAVQSQLLKHDQTSQ